MAVDPNRAEYVPLLPELLGDPDEVWLSFEQHKGTGKVRLRSRIIKTFDIGSGRSMLFVGNASGGMLEGWTLLPLSANRRRNYLNNQRVGRLYYGKKGGT